MALQTYTATVLIRGGRPGIGAVVAMVAAARMAVGGWRSVGQINWEALTHLDLASAWSSGRYRPLCGDVRPFDSGFSSDLSRVDCPDCLAVARRAGLLKEVK